MHYLDEHMDAHVGTDKRFVCVFVPLDIPEHMDVITLRDERPFWYLCSKEDYLILKLKYHISYNFTYNELNDGLTLWKARTLDAKAELRTEHNIEPGW